MKKGLLCSIAALIGGAIGAGVTYVVMDKKCKEKIESESQALEVYYNMKFENAVVDMKEANKALSEKVLQLEDQIKGESPVAYAKKHDLIEKSSIQEPPKQEGNWNVFDAQPEMLKMFEEEDKKRAAKEKERRKNMGKDADSALSRYAGTEPYVITASEWNQTPDDFGIASFYYTSDHFLIDEDKDVVDDAAALIGSATVDMLKEFNGSEVYVRNERIMMDYEILLVEDTLEEIQAYPA